MPRAYVLVRREPMYRREAIVNGLKRLGYRVDLGEQQMNWMSFVPDSRDDLLILWNLKAGIEQEHAARFEARGGSVIVMENGYLQKVDKTVYAMSVHGHNGSGWFPYDPSEDRFTRLGFPQQLWRERGDHILVCGQRGVGSREMRSPANWGEVATDRLKTRFMVRGGGGKLLRPVRFRKHPGNFVPTVALEKDLEYAWACTIWSSASGVRALVAGIPVYYDAPTWICAGASSVLKYLKADEEAVRHTPLTVAVALNRMAHAQWSVDEIESAEPFARMMSQGWGDETWS